MLRDNNLFIVDQSLPGYKAKELLSPVFILRWTLNKPPPASCAARYLLPFARINNSAYLMF